LPFPDSFVFLQHHLTENQVQVGFSYRFDWTIPAPVAEPVPVVAPGPAAPGPVFAPGPAVPPGPPANRS
jgi:hypothetical protein